MEPQTFICGNTIGPWALRRQRGPSMEPQTFICGNNHTISKQIVARAPSMEPQTFICGNRGAAGGAGIGGRSKTFNGAADLHLRKLAAAPLSVRLV